MNVSLPPSGILLFACSSKRTVHSRAYINFQYPEDVIDFKVKFDRHLFVSSKGSQYQCEVEYAPFQRVPLAQEKIDPREGTLAEGGCCSQQTHVAVRGSTH